jgi:hypothetical protein
MKFNFYRISLLTLLSFVYQSCTQMPEKLKKEELQKALVKDDSEMLKRFNNTLSEQEKLPVSEIQKNQILSFSLNKSVQQKVEAVLANNPSDTKENTKNTEPVESLNIDSVLLTDRIVIENGALLMGVKDLNQTYNSLKEIFASNNCELENEREYTSNFRKENTFTINVEPEHFKEVFDKINKLSLVLRERRIWKQDASAQFVDLRSRINSKLNARKRLESHLKTTNNTQDILSVQRQMDSLTEELESLVHTTRAMSLKTRSSSITVTFYQEQAVEVQQANLGNRMATAAVEGWVSFKDFMVYLSYQWPYLIIISVFLGTAILASYNSRRQAMKFKKAQAKLIQQQLNKTK